MQGIPKCTEGIAFFVVIPVRGNKYYIPPNRIDPSNTVKFLGNKNYEEFWIFVRPNYIFYAFSYSPKNTFFLHIFTCKDTHGTAKSSTFILDRPVCEKWCAHDCIPQQKNSNRNLRSILKIHISTTNFDHLDFRKHPNEEAPLLAVRQTRHHQ